MPGEGDFPLGPRRTPTGLSPEYVNFNPGSGKARLIFALHCADLCSRHLALLQGSSPRPRAGGASLKKRELSCVLARTSFLLLVSSVGTYLYNEVRAGKKRDKRVVMCSLALGTVKSLGTSASLLLTSALLVVTMFALVSNRQGSDMSIPGDAPQNLLRPEAAEVGKRTPLQTTGISCWDVVVSFLRSSSYCVVPIRMPHGRDFIHGTREPVDTTESGRTVEHCSLCFQAVWYMWYYTGDHKYRQWVSA